MTWTPIDGRGVTVTELRHIIENMTFRTWRPSGGVLHCTGAPNLKQALETAPEIRINNLEHFFKVERGWPSGPHAFVWPDKIWLFTPLNTRGTHSPSWNGTRFGVEMMGDYNVDDDDAGDGLKVKNNAAALFGMMYARLGLDPDNIKMHRDDPETTHKACPGSDIDAADFIARVKEFMGTAGDHDYDTAYVMAGHDMKPLNVRRGFSRTPDDTLNIRVASSASSNVRITIKDGTPLSIDGEAMNGKTKWLRVTTAGGVPGWCAARYVREG